MENQTYDDEINLLDYLKIVLKHKKLICWIVGVCTIATVVISLIMTPIFEAKAVIMPVQVSGAKEGMMALASQFGIGGPESDQKAEIMGLLKSNLLRERVVKKHNLLPVLFEKGELEGKTQDEQMWKALKFLDKKMKITAKQKENTIEISMEFKDKQIVADIVKYTLVELIDLMSSEEKRVATGNKRHLESTIDQTADPLVKTTIYGLIAKQVEKYAMAEATENFAFKVLDPPKVPDKKVKPKRALMVIIAFMVSIFLGVFAAFGREYAVNHRAELSELSELSGMNRLSKWSWLHKVSRGRERRKKKSEE